MHRGVPVILVAMDADPARLMRSRAAASGGGGGRQDLADAAGVVPAAGLAQSSAGHLDGVHGRRRFGAHRGGPRGATLDVRLRWHGEGLDRLVDRAHAGLVESSSTLLGARAGRRRSRSRSRSEVSAVRSTCSRGTRRLATVLVVEVKSVVPDSQAMLHALDRKTRLAPEIARDRGWPCRAVGAVARRRGIVDRAAAHRECSRPRTRAAFPSAGWAVRRWLRAPAGGCPGCCSSHTPVGAALATEVDRPSSGSASVAIAPEVGSHTPASASADGRDSGLRARR